MCYVAIEELFDALEAEEEYESGDAMLTEIEHQLALSAKMESEPAGIC